MKVKTRRKITLAALSTLIGLVVVVGGILTSGYGVYFGIRHDIDKIKTWQAQAIIEAQQTQQSLATRAAKVDHNFEQVKDSLAEVKSAVAVSQNNQAVLSQQMGQMQADMRKFYDYMLNKQTASARGEPHPVKQEVNF